MRRRSFERAPAHGAWTLVTWRVLEGRESAFIEGWRVLGDVLASLDCPPLWGVLLQNQHDPRAFSSFGPWRSSDEIDLMRRHAGVQEAFQRLVDCCHEAEPGTFRLAGSIDATSFSPPSITTVQGG
jgi:hypothetical protein